MKNLIKKQTSDLVRTRFGENLQPEDQPKSLSGWMDAKFSWRKNAKHFS